MTHHWIDNQNSLILPPVVHQPSRRTGGRHRGTPPPWLVVPAKRNSSRLLGCSTALLLAGLFAGLIVTVAAATDARARTAAIGRALSVARATVKALEAEQ